MNPHVEHDVRMPGNEAAEHPLYEPARRHWPGVLAALAVAAVVAFVAVNSADDPDLAPPPTAAEPTSSTPSTASPATSERPTEHAVEDSSGAVVTDEQPVDVSTPPPQERIPAR